MAVHHLLTETRAEAIIASPRLSNTIKNALSHSTASGASQIAPAVYLQKPYEFDLQPADRSRNRSEVSYCNPSPFISETDRNVLILHSSGTTGLPKPIYQSHRYLLGYTVCHQSSSHEDSGGLNMSTLPLYHVCLTFETSLTRLTLTICNQGFWVARCMPLNWNWQAILARTGTCRPDRSIHCGRFEIEPGEIAHDGAIHSRRDLHVA